MDSNSEEIDQVVAFEDVTPTSSPKNKSDRNESFSSEHSGEAKTEEKMMESFVQPNDNILTNVNREDAEKNTLVNNTCGDLGREEKLVICNNIEFGGEHIEDKDGVEEKIKEVGSKRKAEALDDNSEIINCFEDKDGTRNGKGEQNEVSSRNMKEKSIIDVSEILDKTSSKRRAETPHETRGYDPIPDLNEPLIDWNQEPLLDLNKEPIPDLNLDPLDCASSSNNFQAKTPIGPSQAPFDDEVEQQCVKRPCV